MPLKGFFSQLPLFESEPGPGWDVGTIASGDVTTNGQTVKGTAVYRLVRDCGVTQEDDGQPLHAETILALSYSGAARVRFVCYSPESDGRVYADETILSGTGNATFELPADCVAVEFLPLPEFHIGSMNLSWNEHYGNSLTL